MNKINWGIIGCGDVCEVKSGPAFQIIENSSLVAVMRRNEDKVKDFAKRHRVEKWYTNAEALIHDNNVNAIYVATPPNMHAYYSIMSLNAGKPVYVEKPMAIDYTECLQMMETSIKTGVPLFVAYYRRAFPYFLKIKEIVDNDEIGTVLTMNLTTILPPRETDYNQKSPHWHIVSEISGGGYFFDLACHQLDILDFLLGPVEDVNGFYTNRANIYQVEDTLVANLKFKSEILGSCCWSYAGTINNETDRIEIFGTKGQVTFSITADSPIILKDENGIKNLSFEKPKHVELPMIQEVVGSLLGKNSFKSNKESASRTAWVMDKIMGRL